MSTAAADEQAALLVLVTERLERLGIRYMVSGSLASSIHGEPRMTRDIDIVVDGSADQLATFAAMFDQKSHYVTDPSSALEHESMFTIIEIDTGWKVDLVIRKDREFSRAEMSRRSPARIAGADIYVVSVEDSILSKLEWARLSGSARQLEDARGVVAVNRRSLDLDYLRRWAGELGVDQLLDEALSGS